MNKIVTALIGVLGGAAVGSGVTYFVLDRKYSNTIKALEAHIEYLESKREKSECEPDPNADISTNDGSTDTSEATEASEDKEESEPERVYEHNINTKAIDYTMNCQEVISHLKSSYELIDSEAAKLARVLAADPYYITYEAYEEVESPTYKADYSHVVLEYFREDNVMSYFDGDIRTLENDPDLYSAGIMTNYEAAVGNEWASVEDWETMELGWPDGVACIRNDQLQTDFQILIDPGSYAEHYTQSFLRNKNGVDLDG